MQLTLIGTGGGNPETLTIQALNALQEADLVIGAGRLLEGLREKITGDSLAAISAADILQAIRRADAELHLEKICVAYSGDSGFYSGTRSLLPLLEEAGMEAVIFPGISSVQLMSSAAGIPWQEWNLVSAHGVEPDPVSAVMQGKQTFFLTDGKLTPAVLCGKLTDAGLGGVSCIVGERLSYPDQKITRGTAEELRQKTFSPLSVMLADPAPAGLRKLPGIPDEEYLRGQVPMTKREVRASILSHLELNPTDVVWDVGAGTGGVSVELALAVRQGAVYAVECNPEGCELIRRNRERFGAYNLHLTEGMAPEALEDLPAPDAVFIGGTKKNMDAVISAVLAKNPNARICAASIAIETLHEAVESMTSRGLDLDITQISAATAKKVGPYHMMNGNNPIFLITGKKEQ